MKIERRYFICLIAAIGFLSYLAGFVTTTLQVFPYSFFREAFVSLHPNDPVVALEDSDMYVRVAPGKTGVTRADSSRTYDGYTLFSSASGPNAYLVDMAGRIVHEWSLPYSNVWNSKSAIKEPVGSNLIFWRKAYLYPNGDLLAIYESWADHPFGYGLVKVDRNSRPLWSYLDHVHHDVEVAPDGRIYALSHRWANDVVRSLPDYVADGHYEDFVNVISPDGRLLQRVSVLDALGNSPYARLIGLQRTYFDPLHSNEITPVSAEWAHRLGARGNNNVLVSLRNLDSLALIDTDAASVVWLKRGPFARQHCSDVLPNGDITVFDNLGDMAHGASSRVIEFKPQSTQIEWEFPGDSNEQLHSPILGCAQRLPNGNTLITEGEGGRVFEVATDKQVVWEYYNPMRVGKARNFTPVVFSGRRYSPQEIHFEFNRDPQENLRVASATKERR